MDALHSLVPRVLMTILQQGPMSQPKLEAAWRLAVGDTLNRVSRVQLMPQGVVDVYADDQRWEKELKRSSGVIWNRLVSLVGPGVLSRMEIR